MMGNMDITPIIHALIAVVAQAIIGFLTGNWWLGGLLGCVWWVAREHTQAEYKYTQKFAGGKRANMPWWGGFDPRAWDIPSVLDFLVPCLACLGVYLLGGNNAQ